MQQLKNFLSKREQSQARLSFAECEKSRLKAKITMTLALLIMAVAGAWAATNYATLQEGDVIKLGDRFTPTTQWHVNIVGESGFNLPAATYTLVRVVTTGAPIYRDDENGDKYAFYSNNAGEDQFDLLTDVTETSDGIEVTAVGDGPSCTLATHEPDGPEVTQVPNTPNQWQFTMPNGNVLLEVEMKDESQTTVTYDGVTPPADDNVTAYKGFELYFISKLAATVTNLTKSETVLSPKLIYKSSDPGVIGFKNGNTYQASGTLDDMVFRATGDAEFTVEFTSTEDIGKSSAKFSVTVENPAKLTLEDVPDGAGFVGVQQQVNSINVGRLTDTMVQGWDDSEDLLTANHLPDFKEVPLSLARAWKDAPKEDATVSLYYAFEGNLAKRLIFSGGDYNPDDDTSGEYTLDEAHLHATDCQSSAWYTKGFNAAPYFENADGTFSVIPGTEVLIGADANEGYEFAHWSDNTSASSFGDNFATITVNGEVTVTAYFTAKTYEVDLTVNGDDDEQTLKKDWSGKAGDDPEVDFAPFKITAQTGQKLTAKYDGTRKVKSVRAVVIADVAVGHALAESVFGELVGTDGLAYAVADKDNLPTGVTAAGMVAYKDGSSGLVIALANEASEMNWTTANSTENGAAAHTPTVTGYSWKLPSTVDWNKMYTDYKYEALNTALAAAAGDSSELNAGKYWTSMTENDYYYAVILEQDYNTGESPEDPINLYNVRACIEF